ncbi:unnamed protein product, partial [Prorocentrum cordatum]
SDGTSEGHVKEPVAHPDESYGLGRGCWQGLTCNAIRALALVDDQIPNALDACQCGVVSVLFDLDGSYPWSVCDPEELPREVRRLESWADTCEFLLAELRLGQTLRAPARPNRTGTRDTAALAVGARPPAWAAAAWAAGGPGSGAPPAEQAPWALGGAGAGGLQRSPPEEGAGRQRGDLVRWDTPPSTAPMFGISPAWQGKGDAAYSGAHAEGRGRGGDPAMQARRTPDSTEGHPTGLSA